MKTDIHKTKVIFRKFNNGEVIAIFPELPGDMNKYSCLNYMHIGQHGCGDCSLDGTLPANEKEYRELLIELYEIGYNLHICKRISQKMNNNRIAQYNI